MTITTKPAPYVLTPDQIAEFHRDGVIVIRGLLGGEMLENAIKAVKTMDQSRGLIAKMFHNFFPTYRNLNLQSHRTNEALKKVAFDSAVPTICAKLMGLDQEEEHQEEQDSRRSLRLLKDGVFGYSRGDMGCGWHVDDKFFWPCEDIHNDSDDNNDDSNEKEHVFEERRRDLGINAWITLSPVTVREGGGLAIAPGTHDLTGRGETGKLSLKSRKAIAAKGGMTTCLLEQLEPDCHAQLEAIKQVHDLEPGDAILHDRYIFHRTDQFNDSDNNGNDADDTAADDDTNAQKFRISLRYMPSDATYFNPGTGIDGAATEKHLETGDPLWKAGEYFPQVWPGALEVEAKTKAKADVNLLSSGRIFRTGMKMIRTKMFGKEEQAEEKKE